jgi:hypothetical protein
MNRFATACRAFMTGLTTTPSVEELRQHRFVLATSAFRRADERVRRAQQELLDAKNELFRAETRLSQLERLPDEAFEILAS